MKKFLRSESKLAIFVGGTALGFIAGNNWKPHSGQINWWLTTVFLILFVAGVITYSQNKKG